MPPEAEKAAYKELKRLKKMPPQMPEHAMIRYSITQFFHNKRCAVSKTRQNNVA